jgi:hypothetical protein
MSQTLTISDTLYARLEKTAHHRGLESIEGLLETWQATEEELQRRKKAVQKVDTIRERLLATYGQMPDSVELIRQDRDR